MRNLILIILLAAAQHAFATWDPAGLALCTLDMSRNQGQVPSALIDEKSDLFLSADYFSVLTTTTKSPTSCQPRTFTKSGVNAATSGKLCDYAYAYAPGFTFALSFSGDVSGNFIADVVTYFEFEAQHSPTFVWMENGQVVQTGPVTHLCRRVVNNKPLPEILLEYQSGSTPQYVRMVGRSVIQ